VARISLSATDFTTDLVLGQYAFRDEALCIVCSEAEDTRMNVSDLVDFVIMTALQEEHEAILSLLPNVQKQSPNKLDVRVYYVGKVSTEFPDGSVGAYTVALTTQLGMGRVEAANCAGDAIRRWRPRYFLLVGIAGGIAEANVALGDVIISEQVIDYELQKETPNGPESRYSVHRSDPRLLGAVRSLNSIKWPDRIAGERPAGGIPNIIVGPVATGDKVIAVESSTQRLRKDWPKLIGVEMEAGGAVSACFQSADQPGFLMIRGVSDLANPQKEASETKKWRSYASKVAAAVTVELLQKAPVLLESDRPREEPPVVLDIAVNGSLEVDKESLVRGVFSLLQHSSLPEQFSVRFDVPAYRALVQRIKDQTTQPPNPEILTEQLEQLARAEHRIFLGEEWCSKLLIEIQKNYGIEPAINSCMRYVSLLLSEVLYRLARYQVDGKEIMMKEFVRSRGELVHEVLPALVWTVYRTSPLLKILITPSPDSPGRDESWVVIPFSRISNDGSGKVIAGVWDKAIYLPIPVWYEYVAPQLAFGAALGFQTYCPWTPDSSIYKTKGDVYVEGQSYEYEPVLIAYDTFLVAPLLTGNENDGA